MRAKQFQVLFLALILSLLPFPCSSYGKDESDLFNVIEQAIIILEAREYKKFLTRFLSPEDKDKLLQNTTIEDFAVEFGEKKASLLLKALKETRDNQPEYDNETSEATFHFNSNANSRADKLPPLTFKKINGIWYIRNRIATRAQ